MKNPPLPTANTSVILVVTDFADSSLDMFLWAIPEAQTRNLSIAVLYPYRLDPLRLKEQFHTSKSEFDREAIEKFEKMAQGLLLSSRVPFNFRSEVGFLRDRITDFAKKNPVTMVVMGSRMVETESFQELLTELTVPLVIVPSQASV